MLKLFKSYRKDIEGNVATMFGISILMIIAAAGASIDYLRLNNTNAKLQGLTDSIVLAAAIGLKNQEHNTSGLDEFARVYLSKTEFSDARAIWDLDETGLGLTLEVNQPMIFMGIFGHEDKPVGSLAKVPVFEKSDVAVALVLDTTNSMRGSRISSLRSASNELIDIVTENGTNDTFMSVVPFTDIVKLPVSLENEIWFDKPPNEIISFKTADLDLSENCRIETDGEKRKRVCDTFVFNHHTKEIPWQGCMLSRDFDLHKVPEYGTRPLQGFVGVDYCEDAENAIQPMTKNITDLKNTVNSMVADRETYIPAGLIWGWRTLQEAQPLTQVQQAPEDAPKIMVLMTDGANAVSLGDPVAGSDGINHRGTDIEAANVLTAELCEGIKSDDIIVYTIALEVNDADTISLMQNCASSLTHFYDLSNPAALSNAFNNIGVEVNEIRLSN